MSADPDDLASLATAALARTDPNQWESDPRPLAASSVSPGAAMRELPTGRRLGRAYWGPDTDRLDPEPVQDLADVTGPLQTLTIQAGQLDLDDAASLEAFALALATLARKVRNRATAHKLAALLSAAQEQPALPALPEGLWPGYCCRTLRETLGATRDDLAAVSGVSASTIKLFEDDCAKHRRRWVLALAHGLASISLPGTLDADRLGDDLVARLERCGRLAAPPNVPGYTPQCDDAWVTRRRKRVDADAIRYRIVMRKLVEAGQEAGKAE